MVVPVEYPNVELAECIGYPDDVFFGYEEDRYQFTNATSEFAKAICARCPVIMECARWAIRNESWGIWGGLTPAERVQIRGVPYPVTRGPAEDDDFAASWRGDAALPRNEATA